MKLLKSIAMLSIIAAVASPAMAQRSLLLIPGQEERVFSAPGAPIPEDDFVYDGVDHSGEFVGEIVGPPVYVDHAPIPLFTRVKYVDHREKHPHAITKIVAVNNPAKNTRFGDPCGPDCVYIEICVPPCECQEEVFCRRGGDRVRYDYGKYKVDIRVRRGYIVVDYQK